MTDVVAQTLLAITASVFGVVTVADALDGNRAFALVAFAGVLVCLQWLREARRVDRSSPE